MDADDGAARLRLQLRKGGVVSVAGDKAGVAGRG